MSPEDEEKESIPDGFTQAFKLPPQAKDAMTMSEIDSHQKKGQAFVIGNIILRSIFNQTMNMLF